MKKMLFIEDDVFTASIYKHSFESAGYQVELVVSAEKGLEALDSFKPDLVILDLMLPRMNGVECIKRIRAHRKLGKLPIIVFTNSYQSALIGEAQKAGASRCLIKAVTNFQQLRAAVADLLWEELPAATAKAGAKTAGSSSAGAARPVDPVADFRQAAPSSLENLKELSQALLSAQSADLRSATVLELYKAVHSLNAAAALAASQLFAQMASAIEALLKELDENPAALTSSTLRTLNQAIELLASLFEQNPDSTRADPAAFKILALDDDLIARMAVTKALERAELRSTTIEDPFAAYELLKKERFDLVITDVRMPGMDGYEFCSKLRSLPNHGATPVIFVTVADGFESRVRSARSGGDDFISKPFLLIELAVKALTHLMREKLRPVREGFQAYQKR